MTGRLSRREFLKLGGLAGAAALGGDFPPGQTEDQTLRMGRVAYASVSVFDAPKLDADTVGYRFRDELLNIYRRITPVDGPAYNPLWYRVWGGYVHSGFIPEVQVNFNEVIAEFPEGGVLCELSVPWSQPYDHDRFNGWTPHEEFRLYYGSTHWVTGLMEGPDGEPWYQLTDELSDTFKYYVPAPHLRPIPLDGLTPLSPDVPAGDKRIEVDLTWQVLTAYEGGDIVLRTQISSGVGGPVPAGSLPTKTPTGRFNIQAKTPSKHMGASRLTDTLGDRALPGVPWTMFFAEGGYAIHGTYWHNNFGWPMSRGCVNMRNEEAKWLFRWTTPAWRREEIRSSVDWEARGLGTQVTIVES
ncbi:MAG: L,D-transpeptidase [Chloroflexi bacterium]|nr:L,D-transpeptidase [Chloroflexota bacterium]